MAFILILPTELSLLLMDSRAVLVWQEVIYNSSSFSFEF